MANYDVTNQKNVNICVEEVYYVMLGILYLENADQRIYGSILKGLSAQQSLGNNWYPNNITKASEVLRNHPFDKLLTQNIGNNNNDRNNDKNDNNNNNNNNTHKIIITQMTKFQFYPLRKWRVNVTAVVNQAINQQRVVPKISQSPNGQ